MCSLFHNSAGAAPVNLGTEVPEVLYPFLEKQPEYTPESSLSVSPSASFLTVFGTTYYTTGLDLNERLQHALSAAGWEVGHSGIQLAALMAAAMLNPIVPIYSLVSGGLGWYRFARIWWARGMLSYWVGKAVYDRLWPDKKVFEFDLSSKKLGLTLGQLTIPDEAEKDIELNIYLNGKITPYYEACHSDSFECAAENLLQTGVYQWQMHWQRGSTKLKHQFFYKDQDEQKYWGTTTDVVPFGTEVGDQYLHYIAGIISTLLSPNTFAALNPSEVPVSKIDHMWKGNHSAFVPLNQENGRVTGLYINHTLSEKKLVLKKVELSEEELCGDKLTEMDVPGMGVVISKYSTLYRIPDEVLTIIFEVLEEVLEEIGNRSVAYVTGNLHETVMPVMPTQSEPSTTKARAPLLIEEVNSLRDLDAISIDGPAQAMLDLILDTGQLFPDDFRELVNYCNSADKILTLKKALTLKRYEYAKIIVSELGKDEFIQSAPVFLRHSKWLSTVLSVLTDGQIEWLIMEAINKYYPSVVNVLKPFAKETVLESAFYLSARRGWVDIVQALLPDRSVEQSLRAIMQAHHVGWTATVDFLLDSLPGGDYDSSLPDVVFRNSFLRALEENHLARVASLMTKMPVSLYDDLPRWAKRYGSMMAVEIVLTDCQPGVLYKRAISAVERGDFIRVSHYANLLESAEQSIIMDKILASFGSLQLLSWYKKMDNSSKVNQLLVAADRDDPFLFSLLMSASTPVIRDQALMEAVSSSRRLETLDRIVLWNDYANLHRAIIRARRAGMLEISAHLLSKLPKVFDYFPAYPLVEAKGWAHRERLRACRNEQFGRVHLGRNFYVYEAKGVKARKAYLIAHGIEWPGYEPVRHTASFRVSFMAPDGKLLRNNHISLFLEKDFRIQESFEPGATIKEYMLIKNHNPGLSFINMNEKYCSETHKLLARKATPFVLSRIRQIYREHGDDIDFITVRSKRMTSLSGLIGVLKRDEYYNYDELILGCCRATEGGLSEYMLETEISQRFAKHWPSLFMDVYFSMKLHPALMDTPFWEVHHPKTENPHSYLQALENANDPIAIRAMLQLNYAKTNVDAKAKVSKPLFAIP